MLPSLKIDLYSFNVVPYICEKKSGLIHQNIPHLISPSHKMPLQQQQQQQLLLPSSNSSSSSYKELTRSHCNNCIPTYVCRLSFSLPHYLLADVYPRFFSVSLAFVPPWVCMTHWYVWAAFARDRDRYENGVLLYSLSLALLGYPSDRSWERVLWVCACMCVKMNSGSGGIFRDVIYNESIFVVYTSLTVRCCNYWKR